MTPLGGITELLGMEWSGPEIDYASPWTLVFVVLLNVVSIGLSIVLARWVLTSLPTDYFSSDHPALTSGELSRGRALANSLARNVAGAVTIFIGLVLLLTPGQGMFLILTGVVMTDLPGKRRLERWLAGKPRVLAALNWVRRRGDREPFTPPLAATAPNGESDASETSSPDA